MIILLSAKGITLRAPQRAFLAMGVPPAAAVATASGSSSSSFYCKSTCQNILGRLPRNPRLGLRLVTAAAALVPSHISSLYVCQAKWNLGGSVRKFKRSFKSSHLDGYLHLPMRLTVVTGSANQPKAASSRERSFWPSLFPPGPIYTSDMSDVDPVQLSELWRRTLRVERDPDKIIKALRHSFAFVVVLVEDEHAPLSAVSSTRWKTVGVGRAVSDGYFIATICDVAVDPAYRRRGIGRRIVKKLIEKMKGIGRGPSGFAVFPPPPARRFFWKIGFRSDRNYKMMAYRGGRKLEDEQTTESGRATTGPSCDYKRNRTLAERGESRA